MNQKAILKYLFSFIIGFLAYENGLAQCKITAPKTICVGDLGYFNITPPMGSTVISAAWEFGDGYSASVQNTGHLYSKSGKFIVKCKLTLGGGGSCEDSVIVDVLKLPTSNFFYLKRDTCFGKNRICIKNLSAPANSSQPITKKLIIWGDGSFDAMDSVACHTYTQKTDFRLALEITDNKGCKHIKSDTINIVPSLQAKYLDYKDDVCESTKICFKNTTDTILNNKNKYTWVFNSGPRINSNYKTEHCFTYKKDTTIEVKYIVSNIYGCNDSAYNILKILVNTIPKIQIAMADSTVCYGNTTPFKFSINPPVGYGYEWQLDNNIFGYNSFKNELEIKKNNVGLGKHILKCVVTRGGCKAIIDTTFTIRGPVAQIHIFNQVQCDPGFRVFFTDESKVTDYKKSSRLWRLTDKYGDSCTCIRIDDINKNKNCNYSKDWYHKHDYTESKTTNKVEFFIYDSITKCSDFIVDNVNTKACGFDKKDTLCAGSFFLSGFYSGKQPEKFSLDSGVTWTPFPASLGSIKAGLYSVLLRYTNETEKAKDYKDDSIQTYKDTNRYTYWYLKDQLLINEVPTATFKYTIRGTCDYKDVVLKLNSPQLYAKETLVISWGDGKVDTIVPKTNYILDSLTHHYNRRNMIASISVSRKTFKGCYGQHTLALEFGFMPYLDVLGGPCLRNDVFFKVGVFDYGADKQWSSTNNLGTIKLLTGESKTFINDYAPKYQYLTAGMKFIKLIAISKAGCKDSLTYPISINDLRAGVTEDSKNFGCGEIKQLHDSSEITTYFSFDQITTWLWDFGNKKYNVTQKDPYHAFNKFGDYEVTHIVKSMLGCTDSVKFIVKVIGPQPLFDIVTDTIGCEPLTVKFKNNSKNCSQFYWRFGDAAQNTLLNNSTGDVTFTFSKPGKFYIKLTGIDTFFSTTTQSLYYCQENFPEDTIRRSVTVLPFMKAGFEIPDTVCVGQSIDIKNTSDTRFTSLNWDMGDGTKKSVPNDSIVPYSFTKSGTFKISLKPYYYAPPGAPKCRDSVEKTILAKGILANFEYERKCESPLFNFKNTSLPENSSTTFNWDFGQANLPQNQSIEKNPIHDYGFNKGDFVVCLQLQDEFGCADSVCQTVINDYATKLVIPNVFTPGFTDGKNDEYEIEMDGEEIYELSIFNRWGQLVYQSKTDCEPGTGTNWNGKFNNTGTPCPEGTYFYIFDYKNCYGDVEKKRATGAITLIR